MAAIMIFPYVTCLPSVLANEEKAVIEEQEVSKKDLQVIYEENQEKQLKHLELQKHLEQQFTEEWFVEIEQGIFELVIPEKSMKKIDIEDYNYLTERLKETEDLVRAGIISYNETDQSYTMNDTDDDFVIQGGKTDFYLTYFKTWTIKWYTGFKLYLDGVDTDLLLEAGPYVVEVVIFLGTIALKIPSFATFVGANAIGLGIIGSGLVVLFGAITLFNKDNSGVFFQVIHIPNTNPVNGLISAFPIGLTWYCWSQ